MKSFIVFLVFIIAWSTSIEAQSSQTRERKERDIPLQVLKEVPKQARSVSIPTAYAYLCNNIVSINFSETFSSATISITNETTGETVFSETCSNPVSFSIDLSNEEIGGYIINIKADDIILKGQFFL